MANFSIAVGITIAQHEGGFQRNPKDSGNWTGGDVGVGELKGTKYGISAAIFPQLDIFNLTLEQAETIYEKEYWNPLYAQINDQIVCNKLFDLGILFGVETTVKLLQGVLIPQFGIVNDGIFGPKTLEAINASESDSLLLAFKTVMVSHAINEGAVDPNKRGFVQGWIARINS